MITKRTFDTVGFEGLLAEGIAAVKAGENESARSFLFRASQARPLDARPWIWLSSTTNDPIERRNYLEEALAIEPANMAARRGLAVLDGHVKEQGPSTSSRTHNAPVRPQTIQGRGRTFECPECGGRMSYDPVHGTTRCERCGQSGAPGHVDAPSEKYERILDHVLPTERAQRRASSQHVLECKNCGAMELLPPSQLTNECAFCGSNQLVVSQEISALLEPQGVIPIKVDQAEAYHKLHQWLSGGLFAPRRFTQRVTQIKLRPAYYPLWSFDSTYITRWIASVKTADDRWERREGEKILFFNDLLVPGTSKLATVDLRSIEPFQLSELVEFEEKMLAGWPALLYDKSLADASIAARGEMTRRAQKEVEERVLLDKEVRDFRVIPAGHLDQSYRQILVPLWVGQYEYEGNSYRVLVNGQSGQVGGQRPRDRFKVILSVAIALLLVLSTALAGWYLLA